MSSSYISRSNGDSQSLRRSSTRISFWAKGVAKCPMRLRRNRSASLRCSRSTERTRYIRSLAREAATLKRWAKVLRESGAPISLGAETIERNMMSRSLPWNVRASPHATRWRCIASGPSSSVSRSHIDRACLSPSSETTPMERPPMLGSATIALISSTMKRVSGRLTSPERWPSLTNTSMRGGSRRSEAFGTRSGRSS